jgi:xanthine dehydrogenase accessory factor
VENEVLQAAADVIASGRAQLLAFTVGDETAWEAHLPCGGSIQVLVQPVSESGFAPALFDALAAARAEGRALAVTTDLAGGTSRVGAEPGEGAFVNLYRPARTLLIVGAVQIAQALAAYAGPLDTQVVVIDPASGS